MTSVYLLLDCVAETCFRKMVQRGSPKNFKKDFLIIRRLQFISEKSWQRL